MRILKYYTYAVITLLYIPIIVMAVYSFDDSKFFGTWKGFTVKWYLQLLHDTEAWIAFKNSIVVAVASALISTAIALPAALASRREDRDLVSLLIYPPVIIPEITEAVSLMLLFLYLGFPLGLVSVLIGHTAFNVAYAYIALSPVGSKGSRLATAARTLGADKLTAFLKVTIPVSMPGIIAALGLAFMMSFTDFTKTLFTKGPGFETLPILVWNRARRPGLNDYSSQPAIAALATILVVLSISVALAYTLCELKRSKG
ncbi:MAG: ABC transporter permease [Desulfurococcales archaeon]|nr:ABC transporter permease [Desulfurococcales archaeon]